FQPPVPDGAPKRREVPTDVGPRRGKAIPSGSTPSAARRTCHAQSCKSAPGPPSFAARVAEPSKGSRRGYALWGYSSSPWPPSTSPRRQRHARFCAGFASRVGCPRCFVVPRALLSPFLLVGFHFARLGLPSSGSELLMPSLRDASTGYHSQKGTGSDFSAWRSRWRTARAPALYQQCRAVGTIACCWRLSLSPFSRASRRGGLR